MFAQLLPLAVGATLSPTLLIMQLVILTGDARALSRAWALAAGRMVSLFVITIGGASLLARLPDFDKGLPASPAAGVILVVAGVVLLSLAIRAARRPATPESPDSSSRAQRFIDAPPASLFVLGAAWMLVNASTLALYIPGLHVVARSDVSWPARLMGIAVLYLAAAAAALGPPLALTVFGESIRPRLGRVQAWMERNGRTIGIVVSAVFGVALCAAGAWNLLSSS